jgi:hypothetical protein
MRFELKIRLFTARYCSLSTDYGNQNAFLMPAFSLDDVLVVSLWFELIDCLPVSVTRHPLTKKDLVRRFFLHFNPEFQLFMHGYEQLAHFLVNVKFSDL